MLLYNQSPLLSSFDRLIKTLFHYWLYFLFGYAPNLEHLIILEHVINTLHIACKEGQLDVAEPTLQSIWFEWNESSVKIHVRLLKTV